MEKVKTIFTQVRPVGYGQSLDYWSAIPAYDLAPIDARFTGNIGKTTMNGGPTAEDVYPLFKDPFVFDQNVDVTAPQYLVRVSAFLTGRTYNGGLDFEDDNKGDANDNLVGSGVAAFYVFDPGNYKAGPNASDETRPNPQGWTGYNDLERRKNDLCNFVNSDCKHPAPVDFLIEVGHIPTRQM